MTEQNGPKGLGGWLVLIGLGVILAPLFQIGSNLTFLDYTDLLGRQSGLDAPYRALIFGEMALAVVLVVWSIINVLLFFGKKRAFPLSWLGFVWGALGWRFLDLLAVAAIADLPMTPEEQRQLIGAFFTSAIWSAYVLRSRRVKNTFIEPMGLPLGRIASRTGALVGLALPLVASVLFVLFDNLRPLTPRDVAAAARAAFVSISGDLDGAANSNGSGFLVSRDGLIVTNLHVLQGSEQITLTLPDGSVVEDPVVLAIDETQDLALLQAAVEGYPYLRLGKEGALAVGDTVFVLGNPLGMEETFSDGLVSALRVDEDVELLQISAPISEGSSGGPVLDEAGNVVGVTTSYLPGGQNLNLAVPARFVRQLMAAERGNAPFSAVHREPAFASSDTVLGRRLELETVTRGLPSAVRAAYQDREPWEAAIEWRSADFEQRLASQGWDLLEAFEISVLETDQYETYELTLAPGSYLAVAVCDNDCVDLDLGVDWPGQEVIQDVELDANPVIRFRLDAETPVTLYASMVDCLADTCGYRPTLYATDP